MTPTPPTEPALDLEAIKGAAKKVLALTEGKSVLSPRDATERGLARTVLALIAKIEELQALSRLPEGARHEGWRCFQCDELFMDERAAVGHFGRWSHHSPACMAGETFQGLKTAYNHLEADFYAMKSRAEAAEAALSPPAAEGKEEACWCCKGAGFVPGDPEVGPINEECQHCRPAVSPPAPAAEPVAWTDEDIEAICRAHDREDSAQRGEPSPWLHYDCDGGCDDCQEFRRDRLSAMRAGISALANAGASAPVAWRYRDAWGLWAYCEPLDNAIGPSVVTEKEPLYASPPPEPVAISRDEITLGAPCTLADCPPGLFLAEAYGTLGMKSEYRTDKGAIEAYIVESGEFFWGDQPQTIERQRAQIVRPISHDAILAKMKPNLKEEGGLSRSQPCADGSLPVLTDTQHSDGGRDA